MQFSWFLDAWNISYVTDMPLVHWKAKVYLLDHLRQFSVSLEDSSFPLRECREKQKRGGGGGGWEGGVEYESIMLLMFY